MGTRKSINGWIHGGVSRTVFGVPAQMNFATLAAFEKILSHHRDQLSWIVELGTGRGVTTLFLAMWARINGIPILTIDNHDADVIPPAVKAELRHLGCRVMNVDAFAHATKLSVGDFIADQPGLLFCDDGDKPRELREYGPLMPVGSIVCCHDFRPREVRRKHVQAVARWLELYEPWHSQSLEAKTTMAVLRRI